MKLTDLKIDPQSLGNKRTNTVTGYRYTVAMPDHGFDKLSVRIDGKQQLDTPDGYAEVAFRDLEIYIYWTPTGYQVGARAKGIQLVDTGKAKG